MSDTTGPRPTPLTEIEKAELLDAIPGDLPLRQTMRRALMELDFNRADLATLRAEKDKLFNAFVHMDPNLTNTPRARITIEMVITQAWAVYRQIDDERLAAEASRDALQVERDEYKAAFENALRNEQAERVCRSANQENLQACLDARDALTAQVAALTAELDEATAGLRRYADALLLAWGGVCPSNWATTGDPMEMAETIRSRGDELQAAEASRDAAVREAGEALADRDAAEMRVKALTAQVAALEAVITTPVGTWQPIETAPEYEKCLVRDRRFESAQVGTRRDNRWTLRDGDTTVELFPTHWQAFPLPPAAPGGEG